MRKTKIICTLGPACWSVEGLTALIDADHTAHGACLDRLREAIASRPGCNVAVMLDTKGPEIRTGMIDPSLNKLKLTKDAIIESVHVGSPILVADGSLSLTVTEIKESSVMARVMNNAAFGDKKNMNLPGAIVDLPTLTEKDASDIEYIREVLGEKGKGIKIIAKIENQEGLENFDEILATTDGIMVARGDLGMEIPIQKVFLAQKMMINKANAAGVPIVTATQMLESMINAPRPTRAECADTANGEYGVEAVTMMANTCLEAESMINHDEASSKMRAAESIAYSACSTTGNTARLVAKYKPVVPIITVTPSQQSMQNSQELISKALDNAKSQNLLKPGDKVVAIYGDSEGVSGSVNTLHVFTV
eukprot:GSChrysophyteH1.ASY1.ANO1.693.1 assembled CDS